MKELIRGRGEIVILAHLSKDNNTEELAFENIKKTFSDLDVNENYRELELRVAPRYSPCSVYILGDER